MDIFVAAGQMLVLFAMMFTGYFLARRDWINDSLSSALSRLAVSYTHLTLPTTERV